ncbi:unnamed protein product [Coffea canephora]|uniref:Protein kinase domain-containing protein n=1 Tax=Coffea canephora TaxID=49390 RepID=A0A068UJH0_COFCA|nr:unnamed protein product [Coffea canephora]
MFCTNFFPISQILVHGDITADNLLVAASRIVKIGDFSFNQVLCILILVCYVLLTCFYFYDDNNELRCSTGIPIFTIPECCLGSSTYHTKVVDMLVVGFTRMIMYSHCLLT